MNLTNTHVSIGPSIGPYRPENTGGNPATTGNSMMDDIMGAVQAGGFGDFTGAALDSVVPTDLQPGQQLGASPLSAVKDNAVSMMRGEIPQDVVDQLAQISAERGIRSGIGAGSRNQNLTARDLGRTSLDLMTTGVQLAGALSSDEMARAGFAENQRQFDTQYGQWKDTFAAEQKQWRTGVQMQVAQLNQQAQQWERQFEQSGNLNSAQIALSGQRMIQENEQFAQSLATSLLQANSQKRIMGVQDAINSIMGEGASNPGFGFEVNDAIKKIIEDLRIELG